MHRHLLRPTPHPAAPRPARIVALEARRRARRELLHLQD
jgi:hypothetical protein